MIRTLPLAHTHRDVLGRVIRGNDIVAWTNKKYGQGLRLCTVQSSTTETVRIEKPNGRLTNVDPKNLLVVSAQIEANVNGNVGANIDLEENR